MVIASTPPRSTMRPTYVAAIVCSLATLGAPRSAVGQPQDATEAQVRRAEEQCRRGEVDAARELFDQAFAQAAQGGRVLGAMGLCEHSGARWIEAETHLSDALAMEADPWVRRNRSSLQSALEDARRHLGRLQLDCNIEGARVRIDGRPVGRLPWAEALRLPAGVVDVEVRAANHQPWRHPVEVIAGGTAREVVRLAPMVAATAARPDRPSVARCAEGLELRGGLCFAPLGMEDRTGGGVRALQVLGWSGVGVAVIGVALAVGLGVDANSTELEYVERCGGEAVPEACRGDRTRTQSSLDGSASAVNALWTVAVVGAATAVVGFVLDRRGVRRPARLSIGPSGIGARW